MFPVPKELCAVTNGLFSRPSAEEALCPTGYSGEKKRVTMEGYRKPPGAWAIQSVCLAQLASSGTRWTAYQVK